MNASRRAPTRARAFQAGRSKVPQASLSRKSGLPRLLGFMLVAFVVRVSPDFHVDFARQILFPRQPIAIVIYIDDVR